MSEKDKKVTVEEMNKYASSYSDEGFLDKIGKYAKKIGLNLMYEALLLWYVASKPGLPMKIKASIYGALGYFISPLDLVPDVLPIVGYTDDAGGIALALAAAHMYVDDEVKAQAKAKIDDIFGAGASKKL